jgi:hypothetical protein
MINDCGEVGRMKIFRGSQTVWREPTPLPLPPHKIPRHLIWVQTRFAVVGTRRLTAYSTADRFFLSVLSPSKRIPDVWVAFKIDHDVYPYKFIKSDRLFTSFDKK